MTLPFLVNVESIFLGSRYFSWKSFLEELFEGSFRFPPDLEVWYWEKLTRRRLGPSKMLLHYAFHVYFIVYSSR
jgi:hypothetical protein